MGVVEGVVLIFTPVILVVCISAIKLIFELAVEDVNVRKPRHVIDQEWNEKHENCEVSSKRPFVIDDGLNTPLSKQINVISACQCMKELFSSFFCVTMELSYIKEL